MKKLVASDIESFEENLEFFILVFALMLERNITVLSSTQGFTVFPAKPHDIVLGYMGSKMFTTTTQVSRTSKC